MYSFNKLIPPQNWTFIMLYVLYYAIDSLILKIFGKKITYESEFIMQKTTKR